MAIIISSIDVEPMNEEHDDLFDICTGKNCMGMPIFEYAFSRRLDQSFVDGLSVLGRSVFPLGRNAGIIKIDVPKMLLIEGVMGLRRLRITLRIGVEINAARVRFERLLAQVIRNMDDSMSMEKTNK